jgi:hypothetical protein
MPAGCDKTMNKLANFDSGSAARFQGHLRRRRYFLASCGFRAASCPALRQNVRPLDGERSPSHGTVMTVARNRFFGICREIICA